MCAGQPSSCYRNWQGADCSERTCPFGMAHVDTPKGDLDGSADELSGPDKTILLHSTVYPYGTQEQFPNMTDSAGAELTDTAHYYMECSNKGLCDRSAGSCECFEGYEGSACQRAACPNDCSGHGTCEHIERLAALAGGNEYRLWDAGLTMGCACDAGWGGADCREKRCKLGVDPLYVDDDATARLEGVTFRIAVNGTGSSAAHGDLALAGRFALRFFDAHGQGYTTAPLDVGADCAAVRGALEGLPNRAVPAGSVACAAAPTSSPARGAGAGQVLLKALEFALEFNGNPGYLRQLEVETHLDGQRPTVFARELADGSAHEHAGGHAQAAQHPVAVSVYNTGVTGEARDHFATQCRHVYVTVAAEAAGAGILKQTAPGVYDFPELNSGYYLGGLDATEAKILKGCLGDADGDPEDNVEVFDWDYGSAVSFGPAARRMMSSHPHAVKLVEVDPAGGDLAGGLYFLTWYEPVARKFILANFPAAATLGAGKTYAVYATDGVVERVIVDRRHGFADRDDDGYLAGDYGVGEINSADRDYDGGRSLVRKDVDPRVTAWFAAASNVLHTSVDTACESAEAHVGPCLRRGDLLFVIDSNFLTSSYDPGFNGGAADPGAYGEPGLFETGNLYKIERIYQEPPSAETWEREDRYRIVLDKNVPFSGATTTDLFEHLHGNTTLAPAAFGVVNLFKFTPAATGNYDYATPCSNRGTCDEGLCSCFKGYTGDNCAVQSALSVSSWA